MIGAIFDEEFDRAVRAKVFWRVLTILSATAIGSAAIAGGIYLAVRKKR